MPCPSAGLTTPYRPLDQASYRSGFDTFFNGMEALTSQRMPVTLSSFKRHVVRTLLPMAPYLHGL